MSPDAGPRARLVSGHLFDAATVAAQLLLFDALVGRWETVWVESFFWIYILFCISLWLKRYDPDYVAGQAAMFARHPLLTGYAIYVGGVMIGALGIAALADHQRLANLSPVIGIPMVLVLAFAAPILFAWAMHRATRHPHPALRPAAALSLKLLSSAGIFAATLYLLAFVYRMAAEMRGGSPNGPVLTALIVFSIGTMLVLFYLPGRIHTLIEAPGDRGNWISFWLTCAAVTAFAVTGVHVGF